MEFLSEQRDVLTDLLKWRRDVRHFKTDPIDEGLLENLRNVMELSPSVGNSRPWRVIRVKNPNLRVEVKTIFERCNQAAANEYDDETRSEYLQLKLAGLDRAPEHLAVFTDIDPEEGRGLGRQTMAETLQQSTAMAVHTLWLAARAENLGLGMISILDRKAIENLFDCPPNWRFSAYLCIGWPESQDDTPLLHRTNWQENTKTQWIEK